ncbi:hypothetical protein ACO0TC_31405 [Pseudomonas aeruginosa]|uniref:hypothetical protein n=1 Tax=Pseudomonas TaxID=286 RepID=UPI001FFDA9F9|nr:hypothetical protein [Pseudomonas sp. PNPG3]MCK2119935.1 hypothetical protein [Pseudomonas sp. PNPG3]
MPADRFEASAQAAGTAANTLRALAYWSAWAQLRYGRDLDAGAVPEAVAVQFILDHLARPEGDGWPHLLPPALDAALVAVRVKAQPGPLSYNTVRHRLAVLAKWHALKGWPSPTEVPTLKTLLREAHSLRSGFATEAGRKSVPLGEVMAMTEYRSVGTVMGYFQAGALLNSRATELLADPAPPEASAHQSPDHPATTGSTIENGMKKT